MSSLGSFARWVTPEESPTYKPVLPQHLTRHIKAERISQDEVHRD
jgi:hypothetical protein